MDILFCAVITYGLYRECFRPNVFLADPFKDSFLKNQILILRTTFHLVYYYFYFFPLSLQSLSWRKKIFGSQVKKAFHIWLVFFSTIKSSFSFVKHASRPNFFIFVRDPVVWQKAWLKTEIGFVFKLWQVVPFRIPSYRSAFC